MIIIGVIAYKEVLTGNTMVVNIMVALVGLLAGIKLPVESIEKVIGLKKE